MANEWESNPEIQRFRDYLRIPTVQPNVDYTECIEFLKKQARELNLPIEIHYPVDLKKPVAVLTWQGTDPTLPSIVLNSHMDVVPVYEELWSHPPFAAEIDESGKIFARGTLDMKSVGTQYLGAIKALKANGIRLKRTVHMTFVPEEQIGSDEGMREFVKTEAFRNLNLGFALDEGLASPDETFPVFYAERTIWKVRFIARGMSGHGSMLHENTAAEKIRHILDRMMDYRAKQVERLKNNPKLTLGDVTTVNLVIINGGVLNNIIPPLVTALFDCRLAIDVDYDEFENMLKAWCKEAGGDVDVEFDVKFPKVQPTPIDDSSVFWKAFRETMVDDLQLKIRPSVFQGRTDSCFIREQNLPALGFSPMNNTPVLLHDNDEYVSADVYLKGILIYTKLIEKLANA